MLILYKILPFLLLPPGLSVLLVALGTLMRRRLPVWVGIGLLWLASMPLVANALIGLLEGPPERIAASSLPQADAIVVLGGMTLQLPGAPLGEWGEAADRFEGGVELLKAGRAPLLVFTGGRLPWKSNFLPEGELLRRRALLLGVPESAVMVTGVAANTAEEARRTKELIGAGRRIILVTSAFHMPRSLVLYRRAGFRVEPCRLDYRVEPEARLTVLSFLPDPEALQLSFTAMREVMGIAWYALRRE